MAYGRQTDKPGNRRGKGFARAGGLVQSQIASAGKSRGFAVSRLLTHWAEVVGEDVARLCRPVKVGHGRGGLGATLTLLARGAAGPMLQAQLPVIRERVNACYGYNAVARITLTQTAAEGFGEAPQAGYTAPPTHRRPSPDTERRAETETAKIADPELRAALAGLGTKVLSRTRS